MTHNADDVRMELSRDDLLRLLRTFAPVVRIYLDAFGDNELMSLTEKLRFQDVEDALAEWDAHNDGRITERTDDQ